MGWVNGQPPTGAEHSSPCPQRPHEGNRQMFDHVLFSSCRPLSADILRMFRHKRKFWSSALPISCWLKVMQIWLENCLRVGCKQYPLLVYPVSKVQGFVPFC